MKQTIKHHWLQLKQKRPITPSDLSVFLRQFATLITAGIPIIKSCEILERSQEKMAMRLLIFTIKREILIGKTLSHGLAQHTQHFDGLTCQFIRIGEQTGRLDTMLTAAARYHENRLAFNKQIKQALFYPCIIMVVALIVTLSMFIFVIPRFAELFQGAGNKLPLLTRVIFFLAAYINHYFAGPILLILLFLLPILSKSTLIKNKFNFQQWLVRLPFVKQCGRKIMLTRFANHLSISLMAGIPLIDALKLTANACSDPVFLTVINTLRNKVSAGHALHQAMQTYPFPQLMIQMVKIGEESGQLEPMLDKIAEFLDTEIEQLMGYFNQLLEPLIMVVLGVLIGGLVIGMYLPLFKLGYLN
ncbi:Type II secretion system protein F [Aquicella lusitana]|uniref:Type II secretion system protein F (GspF) n=2 Tax=Aquicella lusitana TaxID=254246 RepID=A0A370GDM0_9COXI|nr:type II secretion system protein F (GspF) [Aquicella lusitana]VVC73696.1 Type II secretion system protein F [Aquicella lusitana]